MSDSPEPSTADAVLSLSSLLKHAVIDGEGRALGKLSDVVTRLRDNDYPLLTGLVIALGNAGYFVPMRDVTSIDPEAVRLRTAKVDLRPFERRDGELLLKENILGHRLIDVAHSALVKAYDVRLALAANSWIVTGLDVHKGRWFHLGRHEEHPARDWHSFLLLMGDQRGSGSRSAASRVTKLKPAQIADIIESASSREENVLLAHVHEDPELEADVFEELDDNKQARLLHARTDEEVAALLARMRADDAADAMMDLAQERRQGVIDLLPEVQKTKVLTLLGYHQATAGGLMGPEYLALPEEKTVGDALQAVRSATTHQPEALTVIHTIRADGTLAGTLTLVRALQSAPDTLLRDAADRHLVVASPGDDIVTVTTRMADFNLLSLPVVDTDNKMLGIVTVDDALEAAIPRDWMRRRSGG
ncbi:CBS domain-containing protein/sporulation protein YlmC with PRC-barrel domain [Sphingomonas sp. BE270]|uniref:magnesium transporter MgtE N-terminal domain-containing protein n=1 Tax=unclassified Sphingomonas TaxID=196159 RepID=UPI000F879B51|nr:MULTISPECIES: CBS domain-containing protein [unclassified Sphingomonas]MDR7260431.1 CBS domain-containing protein/sporulation protein YlmC with PRC-barrel domain [Sphingomonas sp. BE270]RUN74705.1 CBS domain-containing protein [Sphingomonas sp. TF3]